MSYPPDTVGSGTASRPAPGEVSQDMCTTTVPATAAQALAMLDSAGGRGGARSRVVLAAAAALRQSALGLLAGQDPAAQDPAALPAEVAADWLRALERHD